LPSACPVTGLWPGQGTAGERRTGFRLSPTFVTKDRTMLFKRLFSAFLAALSFALVAPAAHAQERGNKDEAKLMADAAAAHVKKVGAEKAFKDFSTDKANWTKKDLYVIAFDSAGNCLAHGANEKLIGKNLIDMKDQTGKYFTKAIIDAAKGGSGWTEYEWVHPVTKKLEQKLTYSVKLSGVDGVVGVGIYR
jgi:signal transduction histidine kinase